MGKGWDGKDIERQVANRREYREHPNTGKNGGYRSIAAEAGAYDFSQQGMHAFQSWCTDWGREALRVLKPGAHALVCGSPRTYHRLACGLEDAGFEVRDCLMWIFAADFRNRTTSVRRLTGMWCRARSGRTSRHHVRVLRLLRLGPRSAQVRLERRGLGEITLPATPEAKQWQGWGTSLSPHMSQSSWHASRWLRVSRLRERPSVRHRRSEHRCHEDWYGGHLKGHRPEAVTGKPSLRM